MRSKIFITITLLSFTILIAACGGSQSDPGSNKTNTNANANNAQTANKAAETTGNAAPTLTPVYKAYCEALEKKDDAAIRKVLSAETLKSIEQQMKDDKLKSISEYFKDENITTKLCEVKNETIKGDEAVATIVAQPYPNGIEIVFVKEGGEWKLTTRSPILNMKTESEPTAANSTDAPATGDKK